MFDLVCASLDCGLGNFFQIFHAPRAQQKACSFRAKCQCCRGSKSARRAGDQNPFVFQIILHAWKLMSRRDGHRIQSYLFVRAPRVFHFVKGQRPREQLDFVAEKFKNNCARQRGHVHEYALPERHVERARLRLRQGQPQSGIRAGIHGDTGKNDPHVCDGEFGLVNRQHWRTRFVIGECDLPWSIVRAPVFNRPIGDNVNQERRDKDRDCLFENAIRLHVPFTLRELKPGVKLRLARARPLGVI